jgi:hypothetical protein
MAVNESSLIVSEEKGTGFNGGVAELFPDHTIGLAKDRTGKTLLLVLFGLPELEIGDSDMRLVHGKVPLHSKVTTHVVMEMERRRVADLWHGIQHIPRAQLPFNFLGWIGEEPEFIDLDMEGWLFFNGRIRPRQLG